MTTSGSRPSAVRRLPRSSGRIRRLWVVLLALVGLLPGAAVVQAFEQSTTDPGPAGAIVMPSGLTVTLTLTDLPSDGITFTRLDSTTPAFRGSVSADHTPSNYNINQKSPQLSVINACGVSASAPDCRVAVGGLTLTFSQPVTDPILHFSDLGGFTTASDGGVNSARLEFVAQGGVTVSRMSGNANFLAAGSTISSTAATTAVDCNPGGGCGSVRLNGTFATVAFNAFVNNTQMSGNNFGATLGIDNVVLGVTVDQDQSDAPPSFNGSQAPSHVVGDLRMGTAIDAEATLGLNPTTSGSAVAPNQNNRGGSGDGADEDGTWFDDVVATAGLVYTRIVKLSGTSKAGEVCGWIDWNRSNAFDAAERECVTFAPGAPSATLSWILPGGVTTSTTDRMYTRLRAGYTPLQVESPTGLADSGEVEDSFLMAVPPPPPPVITKSGAVSAGTNSGSSTVVQGGDTITWKITADTTTPSNGAITVTDLIPPGVTYVPGSLEVPSGWTREYSADSGATWSNTEPPAANDVRAKGTTGAASVNPASVRSPFAAAVAPAGAQQAAFTVTPRQSYCATSTPVITGWNKLFIGGVSDTQFGQAFLTIRDSTNTIVGLYNSLDVSATAATGAIDLSAIAYSGNRQSLSFDLVLVGALALPFAANPTPYLTASWIGPPIELCFQTTVPSTCSVGQLTNSAHMAFLPSAGGSATQISAHTFSYMADGSCLEISKVVESGPTLTAPGQYSVLYAVNVTNSSPGRGMYSLSDRTRFGSGVSVVSTSVTVAPGGAVTNPSWNGSSTPSIITNRIIPGSSTDYYQMTVVFTLGGTSAASADCVLAPDPGTGLRNDTTIVSGTVSKSADACAPAPAIDPRLTLDKRLVTAGPYPVGQVVAFAFDLVNTGNVTLTAVSVADPTVTPVACPVSTLAPGVSATCTGSYTITQTNVDNGQLTNTATASGQPPSPAGGPTPPRIDSNPDTVVQPLAQTKSMALVKSITTGGPYLAGQTIAYRFAVTNTGNVTLTAVGVTDALIPSITCAVTPLLPAVTTNCTGSYTLTQADVNNGRVDNTATATGTPPSGPPILSPTSTASLVIPSTAAVTIDKTLATAGPFTVGDTVTFNFAVKNTGNVTLTSVTVNDPLVGLYGLSCPASTLLPGASTTCTASYDIPQADFDLGRMTNTATASGQPPTSAGGSTPARIVSSPDTVTTPLPAAPSVAIDKSLTTAGPYTVGQVLAYRFDVTNTGNVTLSGVTVIDGLIAVVSCPGGTLAPAAFATCTASYIVTQADVNAGRIVNMATASGQPPTPAGGVLPPRVASSPDTVTTLIPPLPALTLVKSLVTAGPYSVGQTVQYTFHATNSGNVTLTAVSVADPKISTVSCPTTTLIPGAGTTCTGTYTITQADVDGGGVTNTAIANGTPPTGAAIASSPSTASLVIARTSSITLDKRLTTAAPYAVGQILAFEFLVTNTGTVTLTGVTVADPLPGLSVVACLSSTLAPGASVVCNATYRVLQSDVDAGSVINTATATGTPPPGVTGPTPALDTVVTPFTGLPSLTLVKTGSPSSVTAAGQVITYSFVVRNTGTLTLTLVGLQDPMVGPITCPTTTLAPGASTTCTKNYSVTQADIDRGQIVNTATASGQPPTPPGGSPPPITVSPPGSVTTPVIPSPALTIDKVLTTPAPHLVGTILDYTFLVTNTGNVTLTAVSVNDPRIATVSCPPGSLAPSASTTCVGSVTVTQADVDAGRIVNTATASGQPPAPSGGGPTPPRVTSLPDSVQTALAAAPGITIDKRAATAAPYRAGMLVSYDFVVTNTGNVTLSGVAISDPLVGISAPSCPSSTLAPQAVMTCTSTYTITQADGDAGRVVNTATTSGQPPTPAGGTVPPRVVSAPDSVTLPIPPTPLLAVDKSVTTAGPYAAGQTLAYAFLVTNAGNVTLSTISVTDNKAGMSAVTCPVTTLVPGGATTCTATYVVSAVDVDAGMILNTATASGQSPTPPGGPTPARTTSLPDSVTVILVPNAGITIDKTATPATVSTVGATISYSFVVTNTGNVTLSTVRVNDSLITASCPSATLSAGMAMTCTATYVVTQADVDAGRVVNTATASGRPPTPVGGPVPPTITSPPDSVTVPITARPGVTLDKSLTTAGPYTVGQALSYTFLVTNTGNVTLANLTINDAKVTGITCPTVTLVAAATTTCTATYLVTQGDVDSGRIVNTATAIVQPPTPTGGPIPAPLVSAPDSVTITIPPITSLSLVKSVNSTGPYTLGQLVQFRFVVTNTGNVTLTALNVVDAKASPVTCPVTTLASSASTICTAPYTITRADADAGSVVNTATATGAPPTGPPVGAPPSSVTLPLVRTASLSLDKQLATAGPYRAGLLLTYQFVVTNTGNTTLTNVAVSDPLVGLSAVTCPLTTLAAGATTTCNATYVVTQGDIDAGSLVNTATATGTAPPGVAAPLPARDSVTVSMGASLPGIRLEKVASPSVVAAVGDVVTYSFIVTNTGGVTLTDVQVNDPMLGAVACPATTLAIGATMTCAKTYTITATDLAAGVIVNVATASGQPPTPTGGVPPPRTTSTTSTSTVRVVQRVSLTILKSIVTVGPYGLGKVVTYSFAVTNGGTAALTAVHVVDPKIGTVTCPSTSLASGASMTCTGSYTIVAADVTAARLVNTAVAVGTPPSLGGSPAVPVTSNESSITVPIRKPLPATGANVSTALAAAAASLTVGWLLLLASRRRRRRPEVTG